MTAEDHSGAPHSDALSPQDEPRRRQTSHLPQPRVRQTQINIALQLLQVSEQVVLVRGAAGMGKSGFLQSLAQQQPEALQICRITATADMDAAALLIGFGVDSPTPAAAFEVLRTTVEAGRQPALLVDDAALLKDETLADLLALWLRARAEGLSFSLLLSAAPGFEQQLEQFGALQPNQLHVINLQPFSTDQTLEYLSLRLTGVESLLEESKLRAIHNRSRGVPAAIEQALDELLGGSSKRRQPLRPRMPAAGRRTSLLVVVALSALVLALLAALRYAEREEAQPPVPIAQQDDAMPEVLDQRLMQQPASEPPPTMAALPPAPAAPLELSEDPESIQPPPFESESSVALDPQPLVQEAKPRQESELAESPMIEPVKASVVEPEASPITAAEQIKSNAWLRSRNPSRFTIQLIAASDVTALADYIRQQQLEEQAALLTVQRNQRDWHVVVFGDYPSRAAGRAALQGLPRSLREEGAWIRSFDELQQLARD